MTEQTWHIKRLLKWTTEFFQRKGIEEARLDAEVLLGHRLGLTRTQLYMYFDRPLTDDELSAYKADIKRRVAHEPVAYIIGEREFWSLTFKVTPAVLIPRPDTETLVEVARFRAREIAGEPRKQPTDEPLSAEMAFQMADPGVIMHDLVSGQDPETDDDPQAADAESLDEEETSDAPAWRAERRVRILDVGTGSGAIAIALAKELPYADLTATDVSAEALAVARDNADSLGFADQIAFVEGDLLEPVAAQGPFDLLVSNPPYIADDELKDLDPEVAEHEPRAALFSGPSGLEIYERLAEQAHRVVRPGGYIHLEVGHTQAQQVVALFAKHPDAYRPGRAILDKATGVHRVVEIQVQG